ncbi:TNF receptor-associated factor 2-like [Ptychodera flava]|uniref:TNF receptor-associated factor 2-like n=1 Tax=Ptychodera flava TaxID=63121 RepID=UPI003969F881
MNVPLTLFPVLKHQLVKAMSGYARDLFQEQLPEKYLCNTCHGVLREAVQTFCGHRYCRQCFGEMIKEGSSNVCIACEREGVLDSLISFDEMYNDRAIRRELNEQRVRCLNKGCGWTGFFRDYENHVTICPFEMISCIKSGCNDKFCGKI